MLMNLGALQPDGEWLTQPVNKDEVLQALHTAVWAPNDGLREPWRFIYVSGDASAQALREHTPAPAHLVVVATQRQTPHIQQEDRCAVYGLIQNLRLLLRERDLGVRITMAAWMQDSSTRYQLGIAADETIAAVLDIGYVARFGEVTQPPAIRLTEWSTT